MRDYKKEYEWEIQKYTDIRAKINKELGIRLRQKLKSENRTIAGWITDNAIKYLERE